MSDDARVLRPEREQMRLEVVDLDSQLPDEHQARVVWAFVSGLDLTAFYEQIRARGAQPGRPASDPAVLLALWLYAISDGIGASREIARLCEYHAAYRWLCGGVPVNHDMLSAFRRENGARLDQLLSSGLAGLIAEGLIELDELRIDGTKVAARAGWTAQAKRDRLTRLEQAAAAHVARLKQELEGAAAAPEQPRRQRALQAAQAREARLGRARAKLAELEREKADRAKDHPGKEKAKGAPSVSTSDPEVRLMRMADGAVRPAWNVQVATASGFVLVATPTDRRNDSGMAAGLIEQVEQRCGRCPARLLADAKAVTQEEIVALADSRPQLEVYSPPPRERENITAGGLRNRRSRLRHEPASLQHWRARMASEAGKTIYRRRKLTEHAHAHMKNRGFGRMLVHGLRTVHAVCTLYALALNLMQAHRLRRRPA